MISLFVINIARPHSFNHEVDDWCIQYMYNEYDIDITIQSDYFTICLSYAGIV